MHVCRKHFLCLDEGRVELWRGEEEMSHAGLEVSVRRLQRAACDWRSEDAACDDFQQPPRSLSRTLSLSLSLFIFISPSLSLHSVATSVNGKKNLAR